jgi:GTP cyclohydrolase IA
VTRAVVSIGSNIDPEHNVPAAVGRVDGLPGVTVLAVSPLYRTAPVDGASGPEFLNAALLVDTDLDPAGLRRVLRGVEDSLGRVRTAERNAPRTIDLDVVLFDGFEGTVDGTVIPDPLLPDRSHLVVPAADVAPDWECGPHGRALKEIAAPFREEITPMTIHARPISAAELRYATEASMEAGVDMDRQPEFESLVTRMVEMLGEDPEREGLVRTPSRVAKAMTFLTGGYDMSVDDVVNGALFEAEGEEMVFVRDIEFYSLCEHHMLPFFGRAHVGYTPKKQIIGLSKIARIVDVFARRLQVQERLTNQIADALEEVLQPYGVAVIIEGSHFCMMMRGVQKQASSMVTSAMRGGFKDNPASRAEFMGLIRE